MGELGERSCSQSAPVDERSQLVFAVMSKKEACTVCNSIMEQEVSTDEFLSFEHAEN